MYSFSNERNSFSITSSIFWEKDSISRWKHLWNTFYVNPFVPSAPFLYPLKTENLMVFWCFQGVAKGCIGNGWVSPSIWQELHHLIIKSESSKLLLLYTSTNARMLHLQIAYCKLYFFFFFQVHSNETKANEH